MATITKTLGIATAYGYAKSKGYTGTEEEFAQAMADFADVSAEAETLEPDDEATASYSGGVLSFGIPKGDKGDTGETGATGATGATGNGIASIAKTATVGLVDTYTITFTDGTTSTFTVTNGTAAIDATLSIAGRAADAKATGDEISDLKEDLNDINSRIGTTVVSPNWTQGVINSSGQIVANDSLKYTPTAIKVTKGYIYTVGDNNIIYRIKFYANEPTIGTTWPTSQTTDTQTSYVADADGWIAIVVYNANTDDVVGALPAGVTLGSLNDRTTALEAENDAIDAEILSINEDVEKASLKNPIVFTDSNCFKPSYALGACTVGSEVTFTANSARNVCRITVYDSFSALQIMYAVGASEISAVVTDADNKVLKVYTATETTRRRLKITWGDVVGAKYIYWCALSGKNAKGLYEFVGEYVIYHGNRIDAFISTATVCGDIIEGKNALLCEVDSTNNAVEISYTEQDGDFTTGIWIKVPKYDDVGKIESMLINVYFGSIQIHNTSFYANFLQSGEWTFIKLPMLNGNLTHSKIKLTFTFVTGFTGAIDVLFSPFIITNHYLFPTLILNQDQLWGASETCGFYDYMIDNNIPFTVTGKNSVPDPVSTGMLATLNGCYESGLLDVGVYTNELPNTYPIPTNATSYIDVQDSMNHIIDEKIQNGYYPVSIGCGNHLMPPAIKRCIEGSGYKSVRAGYAQGDKLGVLSNHKGVLYQTQDIISYVTNLGTVCFIFAHGYSNNPSGESEPSLYSNWSSFKERLDIALTLRDSGELKVMNMKQWAEQTQDTMIV